MLKMFRICVLLIGISIGSFAQQFKLGVGWEASFHTGTFHDFISTGHGATLRAEIPIMRDFGVIITTGKIIAHKEYSHPLFPLKRDLETTFIPIMIGTKLNVSENIYVLAESGMNSITIKTAPIMKGSPNSYFYSPGGSTYVSKFGWGVGVGFEMPIIEKVNLDCSAKYQTVRDNYDHFNTRLGISVAL